MGDGYDDDNGDGYVDASEENVQVQEMVKWFFEIYTDPVNNSPRADGEWVWIHGGPYIPEEELTEHFKEGKEEDIKRAAELIDELDLEWTKNDWHPEETT